MRAIDADELKIGISGRPWEWNRVEIWKVIDEQPTIELEQTGRWIDITKSGGDFILKCSVCGSLSLDDTNFCPNCGAKMEGES